MGARKLAAFGTVLSILSAGGMDVEKFEVLMNCHKCYWEDAVEFILGNCEAGAEEKYKFIIKMSNKYDILMAEEEMAGTELRGTELRGTDPKVEHTAEYYETVGRCHQQIGQELCGAMNLDYEAFRAWTNINNIGVSNDSKKRN